MLSGRLAIMLSSCFSACTVFLAEERTGAYSGLISPALLSSQERFIFVASVEALPF